MIFSARRFHRTSAREPKNALPASQNAALAMLPAVPARDWGDSVSALIRFLLLCDTARRPILCFRPELQPTNGKLIRRTVETPLLISYDGFFSPATKETLKPSD